MAIEKKSLIGNRAMVKKAVLASNVPAKIGKVVDAKAGKIGRFQISHDGKSGKLGRFSLNQG